MKIRHLTIGILIIGIFSMFIHGCSQGPWEEFTSDEGGFTAMFPGKPEMTKDSQDIAPLYKMANTYYKVSPKFGIFGALYTVSVSDIVGPNLETLQWDNNAALEGAKANIKKGGGEITGQQNINVSGYEGWEFEVKSSKGDSTMRIIRKEFRIYGLEVARASGKNFSEETKKFLDSFTIK